MATVGRLQPVNTGITLKQQLKDKMLEHTRYIDLRGTGLPESRAGPGNA